MPLISVNAENWAVPDANQLSAVSWVVEYTWVYQHTPVVHHALATYVENRFKMCVSK